MAKEETIKAGVEKEVVKTSAPVEKAKSDKIEVDADTLRELISQNKKFQVDIIDLQKNAVAQNPNQSSPLMLDNTPKYKTPKIRKWEGKYFLGYENIGKPNKPIYVYNEYNAQTREMEQFCNVILEGNDKPLRLNYVDFARESERELVKIKKTIELPDLVTNQGFVQKKDFADNGYGMFETMVSVPLNIVEKQYNYIIEVEDGRELEVSGEVFK